MVSEREREFEAVGKLAMAVTGELVWTWVLSQLLIPRLNESICRTIEKCFSSSLISYWIQCYIYTSTRKYIL